MARQKRMDTSQPKSPSLSGQQPPFCIEKAESAPPGPAFCLELKYVSVSFSLALMFMVSLSSVYDVKCPWL
jgi:hypothetical protein